MPCASWVSPCSPPISARLSRIFRMLLPCHPLLCRRSTPTRRIFPSPKGPRTHKGRSVFSRVGNRTKSLLPLVLGLAAWAWTWKRTACQVVRSMSRLAPDPEVSKPPLTEPGEGGRRGHDDAVLRTMLGIQAAGPWSSSGGGEPFSIWVCHDACHGCRLLFISSPSPLPAFICLSLRGKKLKLKKNYPFTFHNHSFPRSFARCPPSPLEHLPRTDRLFPSTRRHDGQGFVTMSFPALCSSWSHRRRGTA
ncbi:hypothetical protein LY76DRAFT_363978 [Colletotrichum caudatum]|nr:hypothetical protein LY76DRAFT_363978 [Colletotrichum caudatum]